MTILTPMTESEFAIYLARAIPEFAQDKMDSGQWSTDEALELSRTGYAEQLPQGLATPDNVFFTVRDAETHTDIGMVWFAVQVRAGQRIAYVYDVYIHAEHQRKGHASRAFAALDELARQRGLTGVGLHVFGHNTGAQALYHKLGYATTNINMFKPLSARMAAIEGALIPFSQGCD
jgi:ribosomal protein S18 acetylase RimI-like enzyme